VAVVDFRERLPDCPRRSRGIWCILRCFAAAADREPPKVERLAQRTNLPLTRLLIVGRYADDVLALSCATLPKSGHVAIPRLIASAASSDLEATPSLPKMWIRCVFTVARETNIRVAISGLLRC
jgi:hypothetical protein